MMCMAELHGGVCHLTSTPHKSGNKMKEKKKNHMGTPMFFSLVARTATLVNSCNLHKSKMAAIDSG